MTTKKTNSIRDSIEHIKDILNAIDTVSMIIDSSREIVYYNPPLLKKFLLTDDKLRSCKPGDIFRCKNANSQGGCGKTDFCTVCGTSEAIEAAFSKKQTVRKECSIVTETGSPVAAFELMVNAVPVNTGGTMFLLLTLEDISSIKRREELEQTFLHDILNSAVIIKGTVELFFARKFDKETVREYSTLAIKATEQLLEEIEMHRDLTYAENNELQPKARKVDAAKILAAVKESYLNHKSSYKKNIEIDHSGHSGTFRTDPVLLRRAVGNLLKNALEATPKGGTALIKCSCSGRGVLFTVHSDSFMPDEVKLNVFKRNFSTKGKHRGTGTFSVRLIVTRYLKGKAWFETDSRKGTDFFIELPAATSSKPPLRVSKQ